MQPEAVGKLSDADLVHRARERDRDAFAALYVRHQAVVYRFAYTMTGSGPVAEDVVQEVFLTLMRNLWKYSPHQSALPTYLYGVARNIARARTRKEARFVDFEAVDPAAAGQDPGAAMVETERLRALRAAIRALPFKFREVLVLCDLHEIDYAQTAVILGIPIGTVRSRLFRARRHVQERLRGAQQLSAPLRAVVSRVFS